MRGFQCWCCVQLISFYAEGLWCSYRFICGWVTYLWVQSSSSLEGFPVLILCLAHSFHAQGLWVQSCVQHVSLRLGRLSVVMKKTPPLSLHYWFTTINALHQCNKVRGCIHTWTCIIIASSTIVFFAFFVAYLVNILKILSNSSIHRVCCITFFVFSVNLRDPFCKLFIIFVSNKVFSNN